MGRKRMKGTKYSRVTKQQKYVFLKLCITEKQSIHQAAFNAGIHYSTAKTILFFHKKQYKNYTAYFVNEPGSKPASGNTLEASYKDIPIDVDGSEVFQQGIEIIVNSKMKLIMERESLKRAADNWEESKEMEEWRVKLQQNYLMSEKRGEINDKVKEEEDDDGNWLSDKLGTRSSQKMLASQSPSS